MTAPTQENTVEADDTPADPTGHGGGGSDDTGASQGKLNAEAAKYRVRAREAETALTAAQTRIEAFQRREVERLAGEHLAQPGDLLNLGTNGLADFLTDDGNVDPEAVAEAVSALIESRPLLARHQAQRAIDRSQGQSGSVPTEPTGFTGLFK